MLKPLSLYLAIMFFSFTGILYSNLNKTEVDQQSIEEQLQSCVIPSFYDSGGPLENHDDYEDFVQTIYPCIEGERLVAFVNALVLTDDDDVFRIYDGPDTSYPLIYELTGSYFDLPPILATDEESGALTFTFISNHFDNSQGWDISFLSEAFPDCSTIATDINLVHPTTTTLSIDWNDEEEVSIWEIGLSQDIDEVSDIFENSSSSYIFENLTPNTTYYFFVRAQCEMGFSSWSRAVFQTPRDYCDGEHFYDSGGPLEDYNAYEDLVQTIYPCIQGERIVAFINSLVLIDDDDILRVYDGPDTSYPLIRELTGSYFDLAPVLATDEESGALTFAFTSDNYENSQGWDINFLSEAFSDCPSIATNINLVHATTTSLSVDWNDEQEISIWEIGLSQSIDEMPDFFDHNSSSYIFENLTPNTTYYFFIRAQCNAGVSSWSRAVFQTPIDYCNGEHFYDSGGPFEEYMRWENVTKTVFPEVIGERVVASVHSYILYDYRDTLWVYDGPDDSYPLIGELTRKGYELDPFIATDEQTGALTFVFSSKSPYNTGPGWDISFFCEQFPSCENSIGSIDLVHATSFSLSIEWLGAQSIENWEIGLSQNTSLPTDPFIHNANSYTFENLNPDTSYYFFIRSICEAGVSSWSGPVLVRTQIDYCGGEHFYDSGGAFENYSGWEQEIRTIYPETPGERVVAVFNSFETDDHLDRLLVYDGPDDTYPLVADLYGTPNYISSISATDLTTGALTFVFNSDRGGIGSGWDIQFTCEAFPSCPSTISNVELVRANTNSVSVSWLDNPDVLSWEYELVDPGQGLSNSILTTNNYADFQNLEIDTEYEFYVRSICEEGASTWKGPYFFRTQKDYCNGEHFYDSGGAFEGYDEDEYSVITIFPEQAGEHIVATINSYEFGVGANLYIYDGPNSFYPLITVLEGWQNDPEEIQATHQASGALTFVFVSNSNFFNSDGWDISINCESFMPCVSSVGSVELKHATETTLMLEWEEFSENTSWRFAYALTGIFPLDTITVTDSVFTLSNLEPGGSYDFYFQFICEDGESTWSYRRVFSTQAFSYCSGAPFYDDGGTGFGGAYSSNANIVTTIFPNNIGDHITIDFIEFDLGARDTLKVFDGSDISYPLIANLTGTELPASIVATNFESGALTFHFTSDGSFGGDGWKIDVECSPLSACEYSIEDIAFIHATTHSLTASWSDYSINTGWELKLLTADGVLVDSDTTEIQSPYTFENLEINTEYEFYIRPVCDNGFGDWYGPYITYTQDDYCSGVHFYDSGGEQGDYQGNETYARTIYPQNPGEHVVATLNSYNSENNDDIMRIYDGPDSTYPLIAELEGELEETIFFEATDEATGALTFVFTSDQSFHREGWDISITCEPFSSCSASLSDVRLLNASSSSLTISWEDIININQWEIGLSQDIGLPANVFTYDDHTIVIENLEQETAYQFYIRSICEDGFSSWFGPYYFRTQKEYCSGVHFYDSGGEFENYDYNESYTRTIFPQNIGDRVVAILNSFEFESGDYLQIYDGPTTQYPFVTSLSANSEEGFEPIAATDQETGALTFVFASDESDDGAGWDISFYCEAFSECESMIDSVTVTHASSSSLTISWEEDPNVNEWEIGINEGADYLGSTLLSAENSYTFENLNPNTEYDFFIRSVCGQGSFTAWQGPIAFFTQKEYCGEDHFYDSGGVNFHYSNEETSVTTIFPDDPNDLLVAFIHSLNIELNEDFLYVYDGINTSFPLLYLLTGNEYNLPQKIRATNESGALTFVFISDQSTTTPGWDIGFSCEGRPNCDATIGDVTLLHASSSSLKLGWLDDPMIDSWEVALLSEPTLPANFIPTTQNSYTFNDLLLDTEYYFFVRSICDEGEALWEGPYVYRTQKDYCNGLHFFDDGGRFGNYNNNQLTTTTIFSDTEGEHVTALINFFETEPDLDFLRIYNGPDASYPLISELTGDQSFHSPISATNSSGALTFVFESNLNSTFPGWDISIFCDTFPSCPTSVTDVVLDHRNRSSISLSWTDDENISQWEIAIQDTPGDIESPFLVQSNNYTFTSLYENYSYYFYIKSICDSGASDWLGPFEFKTQRNYCWNAHFYDTGGSIGNYGSNEDYSYTIYPDNLGEQLLAHFNCFDTQKGDVMYIYDGPNTASPLLAELTGDQNNHVLVASTDTITGALTFAFSSNDDLNVLHGWDISFTCQDFQPCPYVIQDIQISDADFTSLTIEWTPTEEMDSYVIYLVEHGQSPENPITVFENTHTFENLEINTDYDFYIQTICDEGLSGLSDVRHFTTYASFCNGDHFYDSGGADNNYSDNETSLTIVVPENEDEFVTAFFHMLDFSSIDVLRVYNGLGISYPLLAVYTNGLEDLEPISSTHPSGALTFNFTSNSFSNSEGWDISFTCNPFINCTASLESIELIDSSSSELSINWTAEASIDSWNIAIVPHGQEQDSSVAVFNSNYTFNGLQSNTLYDIYIQSICPEGVSEFQGPFTFSTILDYCQDDHFTDSGGLSNNYSDNENDTITIYPSLGTDVVRLTFLSFQTELNKDILDIYDGPDTSSPLLLSASGEVEIGSVTASNESGALSIVFNSDDSISAQGWDAIVDCLMTNSTSFTQGQIISYHPNPSIKEVNIESEEVLSELKIYDLRGRLLLTSVEINSKTFTQDISMLETGMYYFTVRQKSGSRATFKIIKI